MGIHRARGLPLTIVVAVVAVGAATLILRPRTGLVNPAPIEAQDYFSVSELKRAADFRDPQRLLAIAGLGLSGATLALMALRPPRRLLARLESRPYLGAAAAGAGIVVVLTSVGLPLGYAMHERARDVGLATQTAGPWLEDVAKSVGIEALLAGGGAALALLLVRRWPRRWWVPAAGVVVVAGTLAQWVFPVVVDPLFNRFDELERGPLRTEVLRLADRAGVDVGHVYRIDASRRTTGANAYVNGIGSTKRVVLYDNLIDDFPRDEVRSVVAHELAHVEHRDIRRGLIWLALVAPAGTLLAAGLAEALWRRQGLRGPPGAAAVPALALSFALVAFAFSTASNSLSRGVERSADSYALRLTNEPEALIGLQRRLAIRNISDPDPPRWLHQLLGTHPTTVDRIGMGVAFGRR
jgi:STE24 endopeptidase